MTSAPPPEGDDFAAWRASAIAWQLLFSALDRQLTRDLGIPHAHYGILLMLLRQDGSSLPLSALAHQLGFSPSRLSHAITRLEGLGWVARTTNADDRRVSMLGLTTEGRNAIRTATPAHFAEIRRIFISALDPDDLRDAQRIAIKLIDNLAETDPIAEHIRSAFGPRPDDSAR